MSINPYVHFPLPPAIDDEDALLQTLTERFLAYLRMSNALTKEHSSALESSAQEEISNQGYSDAPCTTVSFSKLLSHLPHGLVLSVAEFLGDSDLCLGMALTCKYWHRVCNSDMCWRMLFLRDFVPGGLLLPSWHPSTIVQTVAEVLPPADIDSGNEGDEGEPNEPRLHRPQPYFKSFRIGLLKAKKTLLGFWRCGKLPEGGGGFVYWILVDKGRRERRTLSLVIDPVHMARRFLQPQERHLFKLGRDMPLCRVFYSSEDQSASPSSEQEELMESARRELENVPDILQTEGCGRMCDPNDASCNDEFLIPSLTPTENDPSLHEALEKKFEMQGIFSWRFSNGPSLIFSARDPEDPIKRLKGIKVTGNEVVPAALVAYHGNPDSPADPTSYRALLRGPSAMGDATIIPLHGDDMQVWHKFANDPAIPDRCDMCRTVSRTPVYAARFKCTLIDVVVRQESILTTAFAKQEEETEEEPSRAPSSPSGKAEHAVDLLVDPAAVTAFDHYLFLEALGERKRPNVSDFSRRRRVCAAQALRDMTARLQGGEDETTMTTPEDTTSSESWTDDYDDDDDYDDHF